jgi:hypothetical protein
MHRGGASAFFHRRWPQPFDEAIGGAAPRPLMLKMPKTASQPTTSRVQRSMQSHAWPARAHFPLSDCYIAILP